MDSILLESNEFKTQKKKEVVYHVIIAIIMSSFFYFTENGIMKEFLLEKRLKVSVFEINSKKNKNESLLLSCLPSKLLHEIKNSKITKEKFSKKVNCSSVAFLNLSFSPSTSTSTSVVASSSVKELMCLIEVVNKFFIVLDKNLLMYNCQKVKSINSKYLYFSDDEIMNDYYVVRFAVFAFNSFEKMKRELINGNNYSLKVGISSGLTYAGLAGDVKILYDIFSDTVNLASRLCTEKGKIQISETTMKMLARRGLSNYITRKVQ